MPLSRTYASLDLSLDIGFNNCSKDGASTNSLPPTFQPGSQLNVQNTPAESVEPSPPLTIDVSPPTQMDIPGPRQSLYPLRPVISSKPKQDLYRQVLISYLKKTSKGRAFYRRTRKSALTTVNSRTELKWMMATHMPKKMSISPTNREHEHQS